MKMNQLKFQISQQPNQMDGSMMNRNWSLTEALKNQPIGNESSPLLSPRIA